MLMPAFMKNKASKRDILFGAGTGVTVGLSVIVGSGVDVGRIQGVATAAGQGVGVGVAARDAAGVGEGTSVGGEVIGVEVAA
jgi:hypothetical protein